MERVEPDLYFMAMAVIASTRSTCQRRRVGAVIVKDRQIISTGYNGAPKGTPHCSDTGCLRQILKIPSGERHELCRGSHAEMNAIAQAAAVGVSTNGAVLYCTHAPCAFCSKAIINAGIQKVVVLCQYQDDLGDKLRQEAGIVTRFLSREDRKRLFAVIYSAESNM